MKFVMHAWSYHTHRSALCVSAVALCVMAPLLFPAHNLYALTDAAVANDAPLPRRLIAAPGDFYERHSLYEDDYPAMPQSTRETSRTEAEAFRPPQEAASGEPQRLPPANVAPPSFSAFLVPLLFLGLLAVIAALIWREWNAGARVDHTYDDLPTMGKVRGMVRLAPGVALYYVQSADKIMVVGASGNALNVVAFFPADQFPADSDAQTGTTTPAERREAVSGLRNASIDLSALRDDIHRLQQTIEDLRRERPLDATQKTGE